MGLDTSHDAWHGAYSAFARWRGKLAELAGIPLGLMEGYYHPNGTRSGPVSEDAMEWAAPREGGPLCQSHFGPYLYNWIRQVDRWLPISWTILKDDPLVVLLNHSDCNGSIAAVDCGPLADRLEYLLSRLEDEPDDEGHVGNWVEKTRQFISGLRLAADRGEDLEFR